MQYLDEASVLAVVVALTQFAKVYVSARFVPIIPVVVGLVLTALVAQTYDVATLMKGLVLGLSAAGLYDQKVLVK